MSKIMSYPCGILLTPNPQPAETISKSKRGHLEWFSDLLLMLTLPKDCVRISLIQDMVKTDWFSDRIPLSCVSPWLWVWLITHLTFCSTCEASVSGSQVLADSWKYRVCPGVGVAGSETGRLAEECLSSLKVSKSSVDFPFLMNLESTYISKGSKYGWDNSAFENCVVLSYWRFYSTSQELTVKLCEWSSIFYGDLTPKSVFKARNVCSVIILDNPL